MFVRPIYYYEMGGQMKTLPDRMNPLYSSDYRFRKVYMLSVTAEDKKTAPEKTVNGLQGWVDCFEKAELAGALFCSGINRPGEANGKKSEQDEACADGMNAVPYWRFQSFSINTDKETEIIKHENRSHL